MSKSSSASEYIEIPKYFFFSQKGVYSGSKSDRDFNYKVIPNCPKDAKKTLKAYCWRGKNCMEKSEDVVEREFSFDEEGHAAMVKWLEDEMQALPTVELEYLAKTEKARDGAYSEMGDKT